VPGREIVVNHEHDEDIYVALRDAFNAAKRQLEDYAQIRRGETRSRKSKNLGIGIAEAIPPEAV
jgi:hypothetical protein